MDSLVYPNCFEPWDTEGDRVEEEIRRGRGREAQLNSFPSIYLHFTMREALQMRGYGLSYDVTDIPVPAFGPISELLVEGFRVILDGLENKHGTYHG